MNADCGQNGVLPKGGGGRGSVPVIDTHSRWTGLSAKRSCPTPITGNGLPADSERSWRGASAAMGGARVRSRVLICRD